MNKNDDADFVPTANALDDDSDVEHPCPAPTKTKKKTLALLAPVQEAQNVLRDREEIERLTQSAKYGPESDEKKAEAIQLIMAEMENEQNVSRKLNEIYNMVAPAVSNIMGLPSALEGGGVKSVIDNARRKLKGKIEYDAKNAEAALDLIDKLSNVKPAEKDLFTTLVHFDILKERRSSKKARPARKGDAQAQRVQEDLEEQSRNGISQPLSSKRLSGGDGTSDETKKGQRKRSARFEQTLEQLDETMHEQAVAKRKKAEAHMAEMDLRRAELQESAAQRQMLMQQFAEQSKMFMHMMGLVNTLVTKMDKPDE